jgi:hypothetical protein
MKQVEKIGQTADNIRVAVRVRPPLPNEIDAGNSFGKLQIDYESKLVR